MAKTRIYYITSDNGDGSSSVRFLSDDSRVDELIDHDPETWGGNEGGASWFEIDGTHNIDIDDITDEDFE